MKSSERKRVDDYAVSLLKNMLELYSPSGQENELSNLLLVETKKLGFHSHQDDVGNVIAESGDDHGSPKVLLCGHMDTVPGNLETKLEGAKIRGRGAVDAKSPLAAMIVAASKLKDKFSGRILLLAVVDEESHSTGMKNFLKSDSFDLDYAVFGEPSNTENIVIGYKGFIRLALRCATKAGHSAAPWTSENAIEKGMELWSLLKKGFADFGDRESRFHSVTGSLTSIGGGSSANVIPSECTLTLDVRVPPELDSARVLNNVSETVKSYLDDNSGVSVDLEVVDQINACLMNADSMLSQSFSWAIRKVRRKNPAFLKKTGTSDMNLLASKIRIPMVAYGPGDSRLDHTTEEEITIEDYLAAIEIYEQALERLAILHNEKGKTEAR
jgi:LysW-gamma-L-lysine carboxypeptidase